MKSKYYSTWMQRMAALMLVLIGSISTSLADTKLYIEDFSIAAGETKKVAVCLDTDESTIYHVGMTLTLPAGLQFVADGNNIKTELIGDRTGGLTMESDKTSGKIIFNDLMRASAINAGNGPIFYVYVKESGMAAVGNITISNAQLKRQDKSNVENIVVNGATVTKSGGSASGMTVAFAESDFTMEAGETKTLAVTLDNEGKTVQGFQANLELPNGWTAEVTGPRGKVTYNSSTGRIMNTDGISGSSGAVLNIKLTASTTFAGSAQIKLTGVKATVNYSSVNLPDIVSVINATEVLIEKPTLTFAQEEVVIYAGKTTTIDVNMQNSSTEVQGFQADLVLPEGWTAAITGKRGTYQYNATNGRITNSTGVDGEEGALFTLALTAPASFEGNAVVKLINAKATIKFKTVNVDNIELKVLDKDASKETALAALKAEITAATTLLGEGDKTIDYVNTFAEAIAAAQTAAQAAEADMMAAKAEDIAAATATLKAAEEAYDAAVKAAAAKAAAKQALTDEIAAATKLLGEADKTAEPGKSLNDAIVAAQAVLANAETTTEQFTAAVETLKAAEEAYDAAVKAAAKSAAKMALTDEVVAATGVLGNADKTAEPGKSLNDAIAAAKAVLASDESTTEQLNAAVETLKAAEAAYNKAVADAAEAAAIEAAEAKVVELKAAAAELAVSAEAKAYEAENVQAAVAAAEAAITAANDANKAVEDLIAKGKLSTDNKEAFAAAVAAAEKAVEDAKTAIAAAEKVYTDQKAADEAAAAAKALADAKEALQASITAAKAATTEGMTEESVEALNAALTAAEDALAAENATVESLTAAKAALDAAVAGLKVNALFEDGKYFIYNIAAEKYWGAANSWGTRASLVKNPDYVTLLVQPDGTYHLESQVSNGGTSYYFGGDYMDGSPIPLTITKIEEPFAYKDEAETIPVYAYTIADAEGKFFGYDGTSTVLGKDIAADSENILWLIATEEEAYAGLAEATEQDPMDATFLITDHTFGRNHRNVSAWTNEGGAALTGGNSNKHTAEKYHGVFNVYQKLEKAPAGVYKFTAQGFYRQDGSDEENLPVFYANDVTSTFPVKTGSENSMADACTSFEAGKYVAEPIYVQVTEAGELTVGAKLENNTNLWCIWDNFELFYYGANANLDNVKNAGIKAEMAELVEKATTLKAEVEAATIKAELESAIETAAAANTAESIKAAIELLKAAISNAETLVSAKNILANMKQLVDATNVYTEEAYNEYYGQWIAKYNDGTITKEEIAGLQDPFLVTGWHANTTVDNFLLSAWDTNPDFQDAPYYINSWSTEGDNDGSNFRVPFFEYWTGDANSLGEKTLTATMNNLEAGNYDVTAWVRVRIKNGAEAPTYGITLNVNDGEAVDVAAGDQVGTSQMFLKEYTATGVVGEDGVLKIKFNIAADNNISWLSFKNVKFEKQIVVNPDDPELVAPEGWTNLIANGNLAGDNVASFVSKEAPATNIVGATIVAGAGKNNSRGIVVKSADDPAQAWDTQFWIVLDKPLTVNSKLHVEFDYAASKAAKASTQAHGDAGNYKHWAMIGDVNFTTEWQHFSTEVTIDGSMADMQSIAFNLAEEKTATEYYFDNFGVWAQIAEKPAEWENIIVNSDMEGESMECFYVTEQGVGGPFVAVATAGIGKDGGKAVKVQSGNDPAQAWDTQFFVRLPYQLPAGTSYKVTFDYKANEAAKSTTQMHGEPGAYIHWAGIGDVNFTGEWQSFELESAITSDQSKEGQVMQSIAFNLAELKTANTYIFDNVKFFVPKDVVSTLTKNPAVNPNPYPVGIRTINVENNNEGIFNLNGQKVQKAQKGIYIINGKKVNMK